MKKLTILAALGLMGCSTMSSYQSACFAQYSDFNQAVSCTKQKINDDPRSKFPAQVGHVSLGMSYMDMIAEGVENGKITPAEGQYLISQKLSEIRGKQIAALQQQQMINALSSPPAPKYNPVYKTPTTTKCRSDYIGGMNCTTY